MRLLIPAFLALALPAVAEEAEPIVATNKPGSIAIALRLEGYRAKLIDRDGAPVIETGVGGTSFDIRFFGCDGDSDCSLLLFVSSFDMDDGLALDVVNSWNRNEVFGRAYLDDVCDPFFEHTLLTDPEMGHDVFMRVVDNWDHYLHKFRRFIDFDGDDSATVGVASCGGASEPT